MINFLNNTGGTHHKIKGQKIKYIKHSDYERNQPINAGHRIQVGMTSDRSTMVYLQPQQPMFTWSGQQFMRSTWSVHYYVYNTVLTYLSVNRYFSCVLMVPQYVSFSQYLEWCILIQTNLMIINDIKKHTCWLWCAHLYISVRWSSPALTCSMVLLLSWIQCN